MVPQATCTAFTGLQGLSREPDLDGGELTLNMSLLAVVARPLIGTPAFAAKHGGGLLVGLSPAGPNAIRFGFLLDWSKDRFAAPSLENRMSTVGRGRIYTNSVLMRHTGQSNRHASLVMRRPRSRQRCAGFIP